MSRASRIVIAEDHTILRDGLKALLGADPRYEICGEAADGREAVDRVRDLSPDVILLDLSMPRLHGLDAIREIKKVQPGVKVLVLTVHKNEEYILAAFAAGADGYVLKEASSQELEMALGSVISGKRFLSPDISGLIIDGFLEGRKNLGTDTAWDALTPREREILKLVAEGHTNRRIAELTFISVKTVERHRANLMRKLDLHGAAALTALAMEKGLIGG
ncbi:MAG: response regulator transcription factor [Pseudomonadota bacterium]